MYQINGLRNNDKNKNNKLCFIFFVYCVNDTIQSSLIITSFMIIENNVTTKPNFKYVL